jgi:hypothetical protein
MLVIYAQYALTGSDLRQGRVVMGMVGWLVVEDIDDL